MIVTLSWDLGIKISVNNLIILLLIQIFINQNRNDAFNTADTKSRFLFPLTWMENRLLFANIICDIDH